MKLQRTETSLALCLLLMAICAGGTLTLKSFAATRQQIFTRATHVLPSRYLGASGVAAYIVSAQGTNSGLLISEITSNGLAARIGMAAGDVLLNLNNRVVDTASQADRILSETPSGQLRCVFARQGGSGLQLYTLSTNYQNQAPPTTVASHASSSSSTTPSPPSRGEDRTAALTQVEAYIAELVNADRQKYGLPSLSVNSSISEVARAFAEDMAKRGFKGHVDPEGRDPTARGAAAGLTFPLGENFGWSAGMTYTDGCKKINNDMMAEPPDDPNNHRGNILNSKYTSIGCGAAVSARTGELIIVEDFAR
jgi:uncharacterized protein YkwD